MGLPQQAGRASSGAQRERPTAENDGLDPAAAAAAVGAVGAADIGIARSPTDTHEDCRSPAQRKFIEAVRKRIFAQVNMVGSGNQGANQRGRCDDRLI